MLRKRIAAAVVALASVGVLGVCTSPAAAATSDGWIRGYDAWRDDFNDEGPLSTWLHPDSNAACMWQRILYAEGATLDNGSRFELPGIDGHFGSRTEQATRSLQRRWGLDDDGIVGPDTLRRAIDQPGTVFRGMYEKSGSTARGETLSLGYVGKHHSEPFKRNTEGKYLFLDRQSTWRQAGYDYHTCQDVN
ncbi:peptidoglycan-binding domain-containing protein [Streptomyces sp. NPDC006175]|uniref:peptidoglycan-binding domain-containing protein n=1 Tax=unclassified Streptomyces TaxID=2593676 RepID=UPI0033B9ECBA